MRSRDPNWGMVAIDRGQLTKGKAFHVNSHNVVETLAGMDISPMVGPNFTGPLR